MKQLRHYESFDLHAIPISAAVNGRVLLGVWHETELTIERAANSDGELDHCSRVVAW